MERLSGLDASFLYLESAHQLMHVCALLVLDPTTVPGGYRFDRMRDGLDERVRSIPAFKRKLREVPLGIDHPVWVDDEHFDIDRHVHRLAVPQPGGAAELADLCSHLASIPLDRSRPLWEMSVIEGLEDGRIAVFTKMHHASVDGVSGANLLSVLCGLEPDAPLLDAPSEAGVSDRHPGGLELFARGLLSTAARPFQAFRLVRPTTSLLTRTIERAREGTAMAPPLAAPRTPFNGTISGRRVVAVADLSLARIKEIKNAVEGATVNDVVLAVSGGALRRYLQEHAVLPSASLIASVPVSVHDRPEVSGGGTNKVSTIFARLGTEVADPVLRLTRLATANAHAKAHFHAMPADALQEWAHFAAPRVFGMAVRMVSGLRLAEKGPVIHNLVISNVPGPPVPLYFLGARIEGLYPLGPIFHGAGLNISVMSSVDAMHVGLIACREAIPDLDQLATSFKAELESLYDATVGAGAHGTSD